ncbi:MAG TPA: MlaD family protein [Roseiarcus sp.]|jgi:phospholipid/cholesterol/gamma-HCH transport system substrate-binding protein
METRANFVLIGAFSLAVIAGAFLFVLWFAGEARNSTRKPYELLFTGSVAGLNRGSPVLFNGLRVGEVTHIDFVADDPRRVSVIAEISDRVPIKADTKARLDMQGLTGAGVIALSGGAPDAPPLLGHDGKPPVLVAEPSELQNILEAVQSLSAKAEGVIGKVDTLLDDNSPALVDTIRNVDLFSKALSANTAGVNSALAAVSDLGAKIGPLADRLQALSAHVDSLVQAVDPAAVRHVVGNVDSLTTTLANDRGTIDSMLTDSAALAKQLNGSAAKLDSALADIDTLVKSVDTHKIQTFVDGAGSLGEVVRDNKGNIDRTLKNVSELSAKLNESADKIDGLMASLQGFVGSPDVKGPLGEVGDAARSVRQLADDLNVRTKEISTGLNHFTSTGLREYEALAVDGRRTVNDLDRVLRNFERNPNELIFGAKPSLPEYRGGP